MAFALGQKTLTGSQSESDSDSNAAFSSLGNGSEHAVHEEDQPGLGKRDGAASHLPTEVSHSQQVFISAIAQMLSSTKFLFAGLACFFLDFSI